MIDRCPRPSPRRAEAQLTSPPAVCRPHGLKSPQGAVWQAAGGAPVHRTHTS